MSSTTLARTDVPRSLNARLKLAELLAKSTLLPDDFRGSTANILAAQLAADSLDIALWTAMQELYVGPRGKIGMSALLMRGLIIRAGHVFNVLASSENSATVQIHRLGEAHPRPAVTYAMREAFTAGLVKADSNYHKQPAAMMLARATSRAARLYAADVVLGFGYVPEDLGDDVLEAVEVFVPEGTPAVFDAAAPAAGDGEVDQGADELAAAEAAAGEQPAFPASVGELVGEVAAMVPGTNTRTRKAVTDRLRALWNYTRDVDRRWSNLPCQPNGMFVGALILERQEWIKSAPFGATVADGPATAPCPPELAHGRAPERHPFDAPAGEQPAAPRPAGELATLPPGSVPLPGMPAADDVEQPLAPTLPLPAPRKRRTATATAPATDQRASA